MKATLSTQFAPAERATPQEVQRQAHFFAEGSPVWLFIFNAIPDFLMVLNLERQIIFANQSLLTFLGQKKPEILGLRPGEALDCVHAFESDCGCGTTEFCSTCGAVRAILASQRGEANIQECRIVQKPDGDALDLRVWATPLQVNRHNFTVFTVSDISQEKRRYALERVFFHDIMNTATALQGFAELLSKASHVAPQDIDELSETLVQLTERLIDEIHRQKEIVAAENQELSVHPAQINVKRLFQEVVDQYSPQPVCRGRALRIDDCNWPGDLVSDPTLLRRVIGNMVKNALEACRPGETVTLGCDQSQNEVELWVFNPNPIAREVQLQIFQRSFSTKGNGRGLGTYSMKLLGERYLQGKVSFVSSQEGTLFKISLPLRLAPSD
ncbi:MAG: ATP-binding protein [Chloroflexota bacterium]